MCLCEYNGRGAVCACVNRMGGGAVCACVNRMGGGAVCACVNRMGCCMCLCE